MTLLCVLDWGLGHAARSLALADRLLQEGETTIFASSGRALAFLRQERPGANVYELPAYNVRYPTANMPFNVAIQLPRWWRTIQREQKATQKLVHAHSVDRIISDSRFGCYLPGVKSILLTHQLQPIFGFQPMSWAYTKYLQRFDEFWVPDSATRKLSGTLSRAEGYENVRYIGPLSRLSFPSISPVKRWKSFSLLSGPEPMRSHLETKLLQQLEGLEGEHLLIRGLPSERSPERRGNLEIKDFANAEFLAQNLPAAEYIICRSGYSTLMDLAPMPDKKLLLIPTPGQTEQEYLARTQVQSGEALAVYKQSDFQLNL